MLFWLGISILIVYTLIGLEVAIGSRKIFFLRDISSTSETSPSVSIVVAARNEERNIRAALQSLLALNYPQLQLIVVNDRSDDNTGAILDEMAISDPRLEIVHVTNLPSAWLGKNHALWIGSQQASGGLLLFTDADVVMTPDTLTREIGRAHV